MNFDEDRIIIQPATGQGPLYRQTRDLMIRRIADGDWEPGQRLPNEWDLADEFGVSQGTVRKALNGLADENMVVRHQGRGTFVTSHTSQRELFHFFHLEAPDGVRQLPVTSRLIGVSSRRASRDDIERLNLSTNAHVIDIQRVRDLGGKPVISEHITLAAKRFPSLAQEDDPPNELYQFYEQRYGLTVHRAVEHLRAIAAGAREAKHLGVKQGAPLLEINRIAEAVDGMPIEWRRSRCDTQNHQYLSEILK